MHSTTRIQIENANGRHARAAHYFYCHFYVLQGAYTYIHIRNLNERRNHGKSVERNKIYMHVPDERINYIDSSLFLTMIHEGIVHFYDCIRVVVRVR